MNVERRSAGGAPQAPASADPASGVHSTSSPHSKGSTNTADHGAAEAGGLPGAESTAVDGATESATADARGLEGDGSAAADDAPASATGWLGARERGSLGALKLALWLLRKLGRRRMRVVLYPICLYFWLTSVAARRASRGYLQRIASHPEGRAALGGDPDWRHEWRHLFAFTESILDRIALFAGCADDLEVIIHGQEHLEATTGLGTLLLGAHLGSFDLLRAAADEHQVRVNVVMYTDNAQRINAFLDELDPSGRLQVIGIEPGSVRASFAVKACLERGEFVALLADRVGLDGRERSHPVSFLGGTAHLPEGPFLMPLVLQAPVRLLIALKTGPDRYEIFAEPQAEAGPRVPRAERRRQLGQRIQAYASRLEHYCLRYPYQWFNFYDFWAPVKAEPGRDSQPPATHSAQRAAREEGAADE